MKKPMFVQVGHQSNVIIDNRLDTVYNFGDK